MLVMERADRARDLSDKRDTRVSSEIIFFFSFFFFGKCSVRN